MFGFLLILLILDGILMTVIILLQSGKGGGLAAMGGGGGTFADNLIGGRQAATLLTKATWIAGGIFLTLAVILAVMSSRAAGPQSILREEFQTAPTPVAPTPLPGTEPGATPGQTPPGGEAGETGEATEPPPPPTTTGGTEPQG